MMHTFSSKALYIVSMNEIKKNKNTNSYTSYNLELFTIFIENNECNRTLHPRHFFRELRLQKAKQPCFSAGTDSASQNLSKFLFHSGQMNMVLFRILTTTDLVKSRRSDCFFDLLRKEFSMMQLITFEDNSKKNQYNFFP